MPHGSGVASGLTRDTDMSHAIPTVVVQAMVEERLSILEGLESLGYGDGDSYDAAIRTLSAEIALLEELRRRAKTTDGSLPEVAEAYGYSESHLHTLVRDGVVENVACEGESRRVRYAEVLAHRLQESTSEADDAKCGAKKRKTRSKGPARSGSRRVDVGMQVIDDEAA